MLRVVPRIASSSTKRTIELEKEENPTKILDDEISIPMTEFLRKQVPFSNNYGGKSTLRIKMDQVTRIEKSSDRTLTLTPTDIRNLGHAQKSKHESSFSNVQNSTKHLSFDDFELFENN